MAVAGRGDMFDIVLELLIMVRLGASNAPRRTIIRQLSYYILHITFLYYMQVLNPGPDTWFHIPVYPSTDNSYDGTVNILLELSTTEISSSHRVWQGYRLPPTSVS